MSVYSRVVRAITRRYPLISGCGSIANSRIMKILIKGEMDIYRAELRNGTKIFVPTADYVGRSVYYFGDLDPKITFLVSMFLKEGDVFIDIGANLGLVTLYAAAIVGPLGGVHAFEPQPHLAELIKKSIAENHFKNITVHKAALGSQNAEMQLFIPADNSGAASFNRKHEYNGRYITVPVLNASECLNNCSNAGARLIKIDVEGHEVEVIRGAKDYIEKKRPVGIIFEANEQSCDIFSYFPIEMLENFDYAFYAIAKSVRRLELVALNTKEDWRSEFNDIVAVQKENPVNALLKNYTK